MNHRFAIASLTAALLPASVFATFSLDATDGTIAGVGVTPTHDFPVVAKQFALDISDLDADGYRNLPRLQEVLPAGPRAAGTRGPAARRSGSYEPYSPPNAALASRWGWMAASRSEKLALLATPRLDTSRAYRVKL